MVPPVGAPKFNVTVPVELPPPTTVTGSIVRPVIARELMVRFAETELPPYVAEIFATVAAETFVVTIVKGADVEPPGTVTEAGTFAADWLLDSEIFIPAVGAGPVNMTVPVEFAPPKTLCGLSTRPLTAVPVIETLELTVEPVILATTFTTVGLETGLVVQTKLSLVDPP